MERREFMAIGGAAAAFFGAAAGRAEAAPVPAGGLGRSVTDFGVEPDADRDQSAALQKAIDQIAAAGQPIFIPPGNYRVSSLTLPAKSALFGAAGFTVLVGSANTPILQARSAQEIALRGLVFRGMALAAGQSKKVTILDCEVSASEGDGIYCSGSALLISNNLVSACAASGIRAEGDGIVTCNLIERCGQFGVRLGSMERLGTITAINNMISNTAVGVAVSNADNGYALIAMNMIVGAKSGGIRALHGESLTGPDLTKSSAESFRNLAIAANVSV